MIIEEMEVGMNIRKNASEYAIAVATDRCVPNLLDGLKPVWRRLLLAADDLKVYSNKKPVKTAKLIGQTMGSYHPHGDACPNSIVQPFNCRYPLFIGTGNWGSPDTPWPAAPRYTELRLSPFAESFFLESRKYAETEPNYDGTLDEVVKFCPVVPGCLIFGAVGLGYGLNTNIPSHNATDVCKSLLDYIDGKDFCWIRPDTCEYGIVDTDKDLVRKLYETGRGTIWYNSATTIEQASDNKQWWCLHVNDFGPGFRKEKLYKLGWLMSAIDEGRMFLENHSKTDIDYQFWTTDKSLLEKLKKELWSSVPYNFTIENNGSVHTYTLAELYEEFIRERCEYLKKKYTGLLVDVNKEIDYCDVLRYLKSHPEFVRSMMDMDDADIYEALKEFKIEAIDRALRQPIKKLLKSSTDKLNEEYEHLLDLKHDYTDYIENTMDKLVSDVKNFMHELNKKGDPHHLTWKQGY